MAEKMRYNKIIDLLEHGKPAKLTCPTIALPRTSTTCRTPSPGTGRLEPNSDQAGRAPHWRLLEAQ
jgi:hypothetical protein